MFELIGNRQHKLLAHLRDEWLECGTPICVVEGFPGVGKTDLAERLIAQANRKWVYVECPEKDLDVTSDVLAHLAEKLASIDYPAMADAGQNQTAQLSSLYATLLHPLLIILDEFQNTMVGRTGRPAEVLSKFLEEASRDRRLQARVLILTNRAVERSRWSERFALHQFPEFDAAEANQFLVNLLVTYDRLDDIPTSRRSEVVDGLGKNPRALTTLVFCLTDEPLDDLFGASREAWEIDERRVSPQLAAKIEEEILKRSMKHLEHESLVFLRRLCVHRTSLRREALEYMAISGVDAIKLVSELTQRFMVIQRRGYYQIHPLVHAIARERWAAESRETVSAHSVAADFYARPFKAKQLIISGRTGGQFAELRYHLTKSGRISDLGEFHERIIREISQYWFETTPIPKDTSERDDHITLLSSVLVSPGPHKLESYLTRLLCARGRVQDIDRACVHARRVGKQPLFQICGEMLAKAGRTEEAITLLKEGIAKVPPSQSLFSLYQSCGEILAKAGRIDEVISFLREGVHRIPDTQGGHRLLDALLYHAAARGELNILDDPEKEMSPRIIPEVAKILGQVLAFERRGKWEQAAERAAFGRTRYPMYFNFTIQEAFSWLCAGAPDRARDALARFPSGITGGEENPIEWLRSHIALAQGDDFSAKQHAMRYLGRALGDDPNFSIRFLLLKLWVEDTERIGGLRISYYHPILPSLLTGLSMPVTRFTDPGRLSEALDRAAARPIRIPPSNELEEKIRTTLTSAYSVKRLNDADYQGSFENAGKDKAESVLQKFSEIPIVHQSRYAYVSIGGADGSEIEWALSRSPITKGVLIEYGTYAAASARRRSDYLKQNGKSLVVFEGDAMQKLGEVLHQLNEWKQAGDIDGIVVSAQSILHELPYRSPGFNSNVFFGQLFNGWPNVFFCCREPCCPQGWPKVVQLRLKDVTGDTLAAMARHVKAHLKFDGSITSVVNDFVEMPSDLALEVLFKVLYLGSTFTYEMDERLTAFDPEKVSKVLERYLGPNSVQVEYTVSNHFRQEYQRAVDLVVDADNHDSLRMPNSFARITAAKRNDV